jgi:hypothetical protein
MHHIEFVGGQILTSFSVRTRFGVFSDGKRWWVCKSHIVAFINRRSTVTMSGEWLHNMKSPFDGRIDVYGRNKTLMEVELSVVYVTMQGISLRWDVD